MQICHITDAGCDFTGCAGFSGSREAFLSRFRHVMNQIDNICGKPVRYAVFGFRTCEQMMYACHQKELAWRMQYLHQQGIGIVFSFAPVHQRNRETVLRFAEWLLETVKISAFQINDIGCAYLIKQYINQDVSVYAGRLFDKTIRENRFNMMTLPEIHQNRDMIQKTYLADDYFQELFKQLTVSRVELDTFPDGQLILPECAVSWNVIYPRILLSQSANCLFQEQCAEGCRFYRKAWHGKNDRSLYFQENAVLCEQQNPVEKAVSGTFRLIYADLL